MITIIPKKVQVRSAIMGRNGRVVLGAYFQNGVYNRFGTFSLLNVYNSSHTFCLDLILLCNLLQCCGIRSVSPHKSQQKLGFSLYILLGAEKQYFMSP